MTRDSSKLIIEHFSSSSCDWTPASCGQDVHVLFAPVSDDPEVTRHCVSILSASERQRAERFVTQREQTLFKQRRAFRRFCAALALGSAQHLAELAFNKTENGRPYLAGRTDIQFSFSCCRFGFVAAWSSTHGVGVDFEDLTRELEATKLAGQFFSPAEAKAVSLQGGKASLRTFIELWSLKEAALKSIGEGIPFGLDAFQFEVERNPRVVCAPSGYGGSEHFKAHMIKGIDHCAALVLRPML
jgi:phosphopantetheinyl transferase